MPYRGFSKIDLEKAHEARRKLSHEDDERIFREKRSMTLEQLAEKYQVEPSTIQCAIKRAKKSINV